MDQKTDADTAQYREALSTKPDLSAARTIIGVCHHAVSVTAMPP